VIHWSSIQNQLLPLGLLALIALPVTSLWGQRTDQPKTPAPTESDIAPQEFDDEIVAIVLGNGIYASELTPPKSTVRRYQRTLSPHDFEKRMEGWRVKKLELLIYPPILKAFAKEHGLSPTEKEIKLLFDEFLRSRGGSVGVDDNQGMSKFERQFDERIVLTWKTSKFMFEKHGGRVGVSKFGTSVSFPGRLALLKEQKKLGNFAFQNEADEKLYWKRINDESGVDVVIEGDEAKKYFQTTPLESAKAANERGGNR